MQERRIGSGPAEVVRNGGLYRWDDQSGRYELSSQAVDRGSSPATLQYSPQRIDSSSVEVDTYIPSADRKGGTPRESSDLRSERPGIVRRHGRTALALTALFSVSAAASCTVHYEGIGYVFGGGDPIRVGDTVDKVVELAELLNPLDSGNNPFELTDEG